MISYDIEGLDLDLKPRVTIWHTASDGTRYRETLVYSRGAGRVPVSYVTPWPHRSFTDVLASLQS